MSIDTALRVLDSFVMRAIAIAFVVLIGTGCASTSPDRKAAPNPTPALENITIAEDADRVSKCSFLTEVRVEPPYRMLSRAYPEMNFVTQDEMRTRLRREARRAGGDTVLVSELAGGQLHGKTYDCPDDA